MLEKIISQQEAEQLTALLSQAEKIVITAHQSPDGDAVGSASALALLMQRLGKQVTVVMPNEFPNFLKWMPLAQQMLTHDGMRTQADKAVRGADLIWCLDHNAASRMGELGETVMQSEAPRVMIDHHLNPDTQWCTLTISHPEMCSTCEVLYTLMEQMGWSSGLTHDEAVGIYAGMMTDTGGFTYASTRPEIFEIISRLLRAGIDKDRIYRNVYYTCSTDRMLLMGYMLYVKMEVMHPYHAALMTLTNRERRHYKTRNGDTEGFVNLPLQIEGMRLSIFLREDTETPGLIRVSTRSVDDFPCNEMAARFFNGGGHKNAAGGRLQGTMEEAIEVVKVALAAYADQLK